MIRRAVFQPHRPRQQVDAGGMLRQRPLQEAEVQAGDVLGHVDQRVVGDGVQEHVGVAQAEVEVHQRDRVLRVLGQHAGEVHRQAGVAHAAQRAGHGHDLASAGTVLAGAVAALADPSQGGQQVFDLDRLGEEFLGPRPHRPQDQLAVVRRAGHQHGAVGRGLAEPRDQIQCLVGVAVQRHQADIGVGLGHDVGKELVARALGLQPNHVHSQEHRLERFSLGVVGIDDC